MNYLQLRTFLKLKLRNGTVSAVLIKLPNSRLKMSFNLQSTSGMIAILRLFRERSALIARLARTVCQRIAPRIPVFSIDKFGPLVGTPSRLT